MLPGVLKFMLLFFAGNAAKQSKVDFPCLCFFLAVALPNPGFDRLDRFLDFYPVFKLFRNLILLILFVLFLFQKIRRKSKKCSSP